METFAPASLTEAQLEVWQSRPWGRHKWDGGGFEGAESDEEVGLGIPGETCLH